MSETEIVVNEAKMLEDIRKLLKLTIEDFVYQMDWPNTKYYEYIKNGRRRPGSRDLRTTHPTIHKVFTGINTAIEQYDHWREKSAEISAIVMRHLMPSATK